MSVALNPTRIEILLRVALFLALGWSGVLVFGVMFYPLTGSVVSSALAVFAAGLVANGVPVRIFERGLLADIGLGWSPAAPREFLGGMGLGTVAAAGILGGAVASGAARFAALPSAGHPGAAIVPAAMTLLFGAIGEELLFRGYAFQLLVRVIGPFATILPSSLLFGMVHLSNQNASAGGIVNTVVWGVVLGYAFVRTQALWLPIGLHFGWNLTLPLFGVKLSGFTMGMTSYTLEWRASALWSGGSYGPEASVLTTAAGIGVFWALHRLTAGEGLLSPIEDFAVDVESGEARRDA
jgi:uncharacterized protein